MRITILLTLFSLFSSPILCDHENTDPYSQEEFKCSLPDVTSIDTNLDVTRFRSDFSKISEVKFPGLIGPLNEQLICKIKCIDGNWVGPLCSTTPDGRFQPILRECVYHLEHPLLTISFKNSSIHKESHFPHGSVIAARCKEFGLYKLKGENQVRCENGEWVPAFPDCIPTNVITNFTGDAPPAVQYRLISGSGAVDAFGRVAVLPQSVLRLECRSPRPLGDPQWTWHSRKSHPVAWATEEDQKDSVFRVTLRDLQPRHSDQLTCTAPGGHTHTVAIVVVNVSCPPLNVTLPHVRRFGEGVKLGQRHHFSCEPGYHLIGDEVLVCMPHGGWSSEPPSCVETLCPPLELGPHLTVVEFNASWGGRAMFRCEWGYRLAGAPGVECEPEGVWSGAVPSCIAIYCPEPAVPENGHLLTEALSKGGQHLVGDLMTYSCDDGFQILGEPSIVCTENGFWSHPPPFCLPPSEIRKSDTIYVENSTLVHVDE